MKEYRIICGKRNQPSYSSHFFVLANNERDARSQAYAHLNRGQIIVAVALSN